MYDNSIIFELYGGEAKIPYDMSEFRSKEPSRPDLLIFMVNVSMSFPEKKTSIKYTKLGKKIGNGAIHNGVIIFILRQVNCGTLMHHRI